MADRLTALLQRFELRARVFHSGALCGTAGFDATPGVGHLYLLRQGSLRVSDTNNHDTVLTEPSLLLFARPSAHRLWADEQAGTQLLSASFDFGAGEENPLLRGLPAQLVVPLAHLQGLELAQQLLFDETAAARCGHGAVVDRLTEVLLIQLLRHAIQHRLLDSGVLAGLADTRLAKAINAVHAEPARGWTLDSMARVAGMSRARFAAQFSSVVGTPPGDYLTGWRLGLARLLLRRGLSVKQVAAEVGYANASALGRVFAQRLGYSPTTWRQQQDETTTP